MYRLIVLLLVVSAKSAAALTFGIEIAGFKYSRQLIDEYQTALSEDLGVAVTYSAGRTPPDILITNSTLKSQRYVRAKADFARVLPVIEISMQGTDSADDLPIAQVQSSLHFKPQSPPLMVESRQVALTLLKNGRVSAIIDDFSSKGIYELEDNTLIFTTLVPEQVISIWFQDPALAQTFDSHRQSEEAGEAKHADTGQSLPVDVYLLYKFFNPDTRSFEKVNKEESEARWVFEEKLGERIRILGSNTKSAFEALAASEQSCILHVRKSVEREAIAAFSTPTAQYLGPAFFVRNNSPLANALSAPEVKALSLVQLKQQYPNVAIGLAGRIVSYLPQKIAQDPVMIRITQDEQSSALQPDYVRAIFLLDKQRVDSIIEYPAIFYISASHYGIADRFSGIPMLPAVPTSHGRIACSNSARGRQLVARINQLLADKEARSELIDIQMADYNSELKAEGLRLLNEHYQRLEAE